MEVIKIQTFSWKACDKDGVVHEGSVIAADCHEAVEKIHVLYSVILKIEPKRKYFWSILLDAGFSDKERSLFFKQMQVVLIGGLPIIKGMEFLSRRVDKKTAKLCVSLIERLHEGCSLTEAMSAHQSFFTELDIALIEAGESSGQLIAVMEQLEKYFASKSELKNFILKSALYPSFLLIASILVMLFFLVYVLPVLNAAYSSMHVRDEGLLFFLTELNKILLAHTWTIIGICAAIVSGLFYCRKKAVEFFCSRQPLRGIYYMAQEIRFCKILSLLLTSGINIILGVEIAAKTVSDARFRKYLYLFNERLKRGSDINLALSCCSPIFSPLTLELLNVGAATGSLPEMLSEAGRIREEEFRNKLDTLREVLAPLLLLLAALVIGAVVCAVLEPLYGLLSVVSETQ